ncbi:uncharacterized protein LOC123549977 [Mercenaria mercenaria]|uniref:uncharacterized protein LOC123549977 n=1 Tax=Mercenaria mercenaria TaxID=6596 RepID=UPI00234E40B0|nr:uncharacterized protein LOC123549977 [Mercenaria mercenaria]
MATYAVLLIFVCLIPGIPAPNSKMCRNCHHLVRSLAECTEIHHCAEPCVTEVYLKNGHNMFRYRCGHPDDCNNHHQNQHGHNLGQLLCKECCDSTDCQKSGCAQFLTTTPFPTTSPQPTTHAPASVTATTVLVPQTAMVNVSLTQTTTQPCVDLDDPNFTCVDMMNYGYCNPSAGAGYALAQKRCSKSCGFCP